MLADQLSPAISATSLGSWARAIRVALDQRGIDGAALCREAGIDPAAITNDTRLPLARTRRLWQLAVQATGDSAFGLHMARAVTPNTFLVLELSLNASTCLAEIFQRIVRFSRVVTNAAELSFKRHGDEYPLCVDISSQAAHPSDESIDAFMSLFVRICRVRLGRDFCPQHLYLKRAAPADIETFERVFRTGITVGAAHNMLVLDRTSCELVLDDGDVQLAQQGDDIVQQYLARIQQKQVAYSISATVEKALIELLPLGEPDKSDIARRLCMSPRSLQRRLAEENQSWTQLLEATRQKLALHYLRNSSLSIVEVASQLGYSDSANFTRACRRWVGKTPSAVRRGR